MVEIDSTFLISYIAFVLLTALTQETEDGDLLALVYTYQRIISLPDLVSFDLSTLFLLSSCFPFPLPECWICASIQKKMWFLKSKIEDFNN